MIKACDSKQNAKIKVTAVPNVLVSFCSITKNSPKRGENGVAQHPVTPCNLGHKMQLQVHKEDL